MSRRVSIAVVVALAGAHRVRAGRAAGGARAHEQVLQRRQPGAGEPPLNGCGTECVLTSEAGRAGKPLYGKPDGAPTTAPVGSTPPATRATGSTTSRNVMEWTASRYRNAGYVLKGGGLSADDESAVTATEPR